MKKISWNLLKSERLKKVRGLSFKELLNKGELISIQKHLVRENQFIMIYEYKKYIWLVPYVEDEFGDIFLKTLYPSRKYTKIFQEKGGIN